MLKIKIFLIVTSLLFSFSIPARADDPRSSNDPVKMSDLDRDKASRDAKGIPGEGMVGGPKGNKLIRAVPTIVATNDGGVVLLTADKLVKYDRNLSLVKEVNISSQVASSCDCSKVEKRKIQLKTRDLGQPVKTKPAPAKQ